MSADLLRQAAERLRDPYRCNGNAYEPALADWLYRAGADLWAYGPLCCDEGCPACDDELWSPHVRRALAVARLIVGDES